MRVIRAEVMGMCFGVKRAVSMALAVSNPQGVTILGELVHNESVLSRLSELGYATDPRGPDAAIPATNLAMVTAHGMSDRRKDELRIAGKGLIDTTCPLVKRVHDAAQSYLRKGALVIVVGAPMHVEVRGIVEDLERFEVVSDPKAVHCYGQKRIGVVCQTTASPETVVRVLEAVRKKNPLSEIEYSPTICRATRERQLALIRLLTRVEAVVVVGGANSNNTRKLADLVRSRNVECFHVQSKEDLDSKRLRRFRSIGLTAGASTPEWVVDEVERQLTSIFSRETLSAAAAFSMSM